MQDFWSYRPAAPPLELPPFVTARISGGVKEPVHHKAGNPVPSPAAPDGDRAAPPSSAPRETDVEMIQGAIKKLLEEVNAAELLQASPSLQRNEAKGIEAAPELPGAAGAAGAGPTAATEKAIESSLEALRMTHETMRAASAPAGGHARHVPPTSAAAPSPADSWTPPAAAPSHGRAAVLAEAIGAGRIDVFLDPILGLEEQTTRHYEVSIRLRGAHGEALGTGGNSTELRGTGLLPLFDCARVARTAAVGRYLEERGKAASVFSAFNGESLTDDRFLGDLAETVHQRASVTRQLVLTFAQSDVRGFSPAEWDSIADMRALGFRFALAGVTDLDLDFEALVEAGFAFVKLDADLFLNGLQAGGNAIPASDICRHLAKLGLTLVVERIDDEVKLARVFGFGVLLGQGQLFGGPRPIKASVVSNRGHAAA
jgi:cyclic-di-GMP phosphodiesterase TipF (flagellum assembly factor)